MKQNQPVKMVRVPQDVHAELKAYCAEEGRKLEWVIGEAIKGWIVLQDKERLYLQELYQERGSTLNGLQHPPVENPFKKA